MNPIENYLARKYKPPLMTRRIFLKKFGHVCVEAGALATAGSVGRFALSGDSMEKVSEDISRHYKPITPDEQEIYNKFKAMDPEKITGPSEELTRAASIEDRIISRENEIKDEYYKRKPVRSAAALLLLGALLISHGTIRMLGLED